jgi:hypothetical protein
MPGSSRTLEARWDASLDQLLKASGGKPHSPGQLLGVPFRSNVLYTQRYNHIWYIGKLDEIDVIYLSIIYHEFHPIFLYIIGSGHFRLIPGICLFQEVSYNGGRRCDEVVHASHHGWRLQPWRRPCSVAAGGSVALCLGLVNSVVGGWCWSRLVIIHITYIYIHINNMFWDYFFNYC